MYLTETIDATNNKLRVVYVADSEATAEHLSIANLFFELDEEAKGYGLSVGVSKNSAGGIRYVLSGRFSKRGGLRFYVVLDTLESLPEPVKRWLIEVEQTGKSEDRSHDLADWLRKMGFVDFYDFPLFASEEEILELRIKPERVSEGRAVIRPSDVARL